MTDSTALVERVADAIQRWHNANGKLRPSRQEALSQARAALDASGEDELEPTSIAWRVCMDVAELPDRTSPEDWPDAMLVTAEELHAIVVAAIARKQDRS